MARSVFCQAKLQKMFTEKSSPFYFTFKEKFKKLPPAKLNKTEQIAELSKDIFQNILNVIITL